MFGNIPCEYFQSARKFSPAPITAHGQSLLWSGPVTGIQGATELHECERTQDAWLRSVQDEFRYGRLPKDTHNLLPGLATMQPGSYVNGEVTCRTKECIKMFIEAAKKQQCCAASARNTLEK